ncbi:MAG: Ig-like domain-containing protein [Trueperaceae bacterium]|nr:Ig-like domain-containing protein [Trueperaceae bacterium]
MKRFLVLCLPLLTFFLTACPEPIAPGTSGSKPSINSFTSSPPSLPAGGGSVTLNWDVKDAKTLSIDNGVGTVIGTSKTVSVTTNTTFTLTATNDKGATAQSTSVTVTADQDNTPPTVISVEPTNGANAIREDQVITITFSEPMNQAATEAAYQSPNLPPVAFTWNDKGTTLSLAPSTPIPYSYNVDDALSYTFSISGTAEDVAGNSLALFTSSFSTLRAFYAECNGLPNLDGYVDSNGFAFTGLAPRAGDIRDNAGVRAYFTFDLTFCLPEGRILKDAFVNVYKEDVGQGDPYSLGEVLLEHVNYGNTFTGDDYNTPSLASFGAIDSSSKPARTRLFLNATSAVQDDLDNRASRGNRSQFRLLFPLTTNNNNNADVVIYGSAEATSRDFAPFLQINYLIP